MAKSLTEMAAEIVAAQASHAVMAADKLMAPVNRAVIALTFIINSCGIPFQSSHFEHDPSGFLMPSEKRTLQASAACGTGYGDQTGKVTGAARTRRLGGLGVEVSPSVTLYL